MRAMLANALSKPVVLRWPSGDQARPIPWRLVVVIFRVSLLG